MTSEYSAGIAFIKHLENRARTVFPDSYFSVSALHHVAHKCKIVL